MSVKTKVGRLDKIKVVDAGSQRDQRNVPLMLRRLANNIAKGKYGAITTLQVVAKSKRKRHPHLLGFGPDLNADPIKVLYQGMVEHGRLSDPPVVVSEPTVGPAQVSR